MSTDLSHDRDPISVASDLLLNGPASFVPIVPIVFSLNPPFFPYSRETYSALIFLKYLCSELSSRLFDKSKFPSLRCPSGEAIHCTVSPYDFEKAPVCSAPFFHDISRQNRASSRSSMRHLTGRVEVTNHPLLLEDREVFKPFFDHPPRLPGRVTLTLWFSSEGFSARSFGIQSCPCGPLAIIVPPPFFPPLVVGDDGI